MSDDIVTEGSSLKASMLPTTTALNRYGLQNWTPHVTLTITYDDRMDTPASSRTMHILVIIVLTFALALAFTLALVMTGYSISFDKNRPDVKRTSKRSVIAVCNLSISPSSQVKNHQQKRAAKKERNRDEEASVGTWIQEPDLKVQRRQAIEMILQKSQTPAQQRDNFLATQHSRKQFAKGSYTQ
ncbi:hypothetical protein PROFUN_12530 [Planoprotostelium fungivorum]|uniref:Uncharacterized protein n=1 Tax=Planoprotostelium fungivorum TaxID=1890364 RepID=A0A2P6MS52_9EUKA|nr:hypothetical protein PROFUN_12530 [Planoprotostelium fungivorum]